MDCSRHCAPPLAALPRRGIVDPYASHRLERGRLTGRQLFEAEPSLALSDAAAEAEAEAAAAAGAAGGGAASSAPSAGGSPAVGGIVYAVDAARYAGAGDLLPDDDDEDEDYTPSHDDGDDGSDED